MKNKTPTSSVRTSPRGKNHGGDKLPLPWSNLHYTGKGSHPATTTPRPPHLQVQDPFYFTDNSSVAPISAGLRPRRAKLHLHLRKRNRVRPPRAAPGGRGQLRKVQWRQDVRAPLPFSPTFPPHPPRALPEPPRELWCLPARLRTTALSAASRSPSPPPIGRTLAPAQCRFLGCGSHAEPVRRGEWGGQGR